MRLANTLPRRPPPARASRGAACQALALRAAAHAIARPDRGRVPKLPWSVTRPAWVAAPSGARVGAEAASGACGEAREEPRCLSEPAGDAVRQWRAATLSSEGSGARRAPESADTNARGLGAERSEAPKPWLLVLQLLLQRDDHLGQQVLEDRVLVFLCRSRVGLGAGDEEVAFLDDFNLA